MIKQGDEEWAGRGGQDRRGGIKGRWGRKGKELKGFLFVLQLSGRILSSHFSCFFFTLPASLCANNALAPLSTHTCTRTHTKYRKYLITAVEGVL